MALSASLIACQPPRRRVALEQLASTPTPTLTLTLAPTLALTFTPTLTPEEVLATYAADSYGDRTFTSWVLLGLRPAEPQNVRLAAHATLDNPHAR